MISIVIPIYNGFTALDPAVLHAAVDKEIILVNDGSTDNSAAVCQGYADRYPEVIFIDKAHTGVSDTRNAGIRAAKGKYIMFLDADDSLKAGSVEALVSFFDGCGDAVDLVTYPITTMYRGFRLPPHFRYRSLTYSGVYDLRKFPYIGQTTMNIVVRNRGEDNVLFDTAMDFSEDQKYCCDVLRDKLKMGFCKDAEYIYFRSEDSSSGRLSGACYVFEQAMRMFEEMFAPYENEVPLAFQGLYINDLAWKLRCNMLYPWHYEKPEFERAQSRIRALLQRVDDHVIWEHPEIDQYHKCYWLSEKHNTKVQAFYTPEAFGLCCGKEIFLQESNVQLMLGRIRMEGNTILLRGFLKSGVFSFTPQPELFAVTKHGRIPLSLYPSAHSYYLCRTRTNCFHAFCLELPVQELDELHFEMELGGNVYGCTCDFLPKSPFSHYFQRYEAVAGQQGIRFDRAQEKFFLTDKPAQDILHDNSNAPLVSFDIAAIRRKAARLRCTRQIHLYYDCRGVDKDNGYYRFLEDFQKQDGIERYYVCTQDVRMLRRMFTSQQRRYVVAFGSKRHKIYALAAQRIITAFIEDNNILPFAPEELPMLSDFFGFTVEYLQHGVLHASVPWKYTPEVVIADKLCISTEYEAQLFTEKYQFRQEDLLRSPMPRLRRLNRSAKPERRILFAPSWREYLIGDNIGGIWQPRREVFIQSDYYRNLCAFLQSEALCSWLTAHHYTLDFKLHPIFAAYADLFQPTCERVRVIRDAGEIERYEMFITDFSSFVFDFLYLGRTVFSYIPDEMQFRCGMNSYREIEPESAAALIRITDAQDFCRKIENAAHQQAVITFLD
ncbi:MAG: glycosyltransferase [Ruminococcus sp.]|nr:glycosyltransferase [Ruminococcus sp.]